MLKIKTTSSAKNLLLYLIMVFILVSGFSDQVLMGQDAQWRGPCRDGIYPSEGLLQEWPAEGPPLRWMAEGLGRGYSSAVVSEGMVFVSGIQDSLEYLSALDLGGQLIWQKPIGPCWDHSIPETRSTPTVEEDRIYVLSGKDKLLCFGREKGEIRWSADLHELYGSAWDMFGVSESVLLVNDRIVTVPCGEEVTAVALDKMSGELIWKSESIGAKRGNMSPQLIRHCGKDYVIAATQTHMIGIDPENGELLWQHHYNILDEKQQNRTILANTPVYKDSCLWISNGWDLESVMLEIAPDGRSVQTKFTDITFDNQNMGVVLVDGYLYGSNFTGRNSGKWVCMDWKTGEIKWVGNFHNKGPAIYADGMLYILEEKRGNMALVKADPEEFKVVSSFQVKGGKGPFWARPTIYGKTLFVRHGDVLLAYDIGT